MSRSMPILMCLVLLAVVAVCLQLSGQGAAAPRLAGAQAEINAADFPSLQAAIDALPTTGGMVRLPAGKLEIRQPLVIEREDVLLVGQGTATNIVNLNEEGQPAMVIRPKDHATNTKSHVWRVQVANLRLTGVITPNVGAAGSGLRSARSPGRCRYSCCG